MDTRVIFNDNATLTDYTSQCNDYFNNNANAFNYTSGQDYLYLGSKFPFNHLYFKFGTANTAARSIVIHIWDGNSWRAVKETIDETKVGSASFAQNGFVTWVPDKNYGWAMEDTCDTNGTEQITGFGTTTIYDHYWVRISFSGSLDAGTTLAWVGQLFSDDNDLGIEYPDLVRSATMNAWSDTGSKTSWEEQHVFAARQIVKELQDRKVIFHQSQILYRKDFTSASVAKVAEVAFRGMGKDFEDNKLDAMSLFKERIAQVISLCIIDKNLDATINNDELTTFQGRLTRGRLRAK